MHIPQQTIPADWLQQTFILWLDADGRIMSGNQAAIEALGISPETDQAHQLSDFDTQVAMDGWQAICQPHQPGKVQTSYRSQWKVASGGHIPVSVRLRSMPDQETGLCLLAEDISLSVREEMRQHLPERSLQTAAKLAKVGAFTFDLTANRMDWAEETYAIWGFPMQDGVPSINQQLLRIHIEDRRKYQSTIGLAISEGKAFNIDFRLLSPKEEKPRFINFVATVERSDRGAPSRIMGVFKDVSEQQKANKKLIESEAHLSALFDSSAESFILVDKQQMLLTFNSLAQRTIKQVFGREMEVGEHALTYVLPEFHEEFKDNFAQCLNGNKVSFLRNALRSNSESRWFQISYNPIHSISGEVYAVCVASLDVTASVLAKQQIEESKINLETILDNTVQTFVLIDYQDRVVSHNQLASSFFKEIGGKPPREGTYIRELLPAYFWEDFQNYRSQCLKQGAITKEIEFFPGTEHHQWFNLTFAPVRSGQKSPRYQSIIFSAFDISGVKQFEAEQESLGNILNHAFNEIIIFDAISFHCLYGNRSALENLGYSTRELLKLQPTDLQKDFTPELYRELANLLLNGAKERVDFQTYQYRSDGSRYPVSTFLQLTSFKGKQAIVAIVLDLSERQKAEAALRKSEQSLSEAQRLAQVGNFEINTGTAEMEWSDELFRILGFKPQAIKPDQTLFFQRLQAEGERPLRELFDQSMATKQSMDFYGKVVSGEQGERSVFGRANFYPIHQSSDWQIMGTVQDITDLKKAETRLKQSLKDLETQQALTLQGSQRLASIIEGAAYGIILINEASSIDSINPAAEKIFGFSDAEVSGVDINELMPYYLASHKDRDAAFSDGPVLSSGQELVGKRKDGTLTHIRVSISQLASQSSARFAIFVEDVNERKAMETKIWEQEQKLKAKLEEEVRQRTIELEGEKQKVEKINNDILGSMTYARRIQVAILPNHKDMQRNFQELMVYFFPKGLLSGDFYWYGEDGGRAIIAAVDCTGHGIPGAFMSMIGHAILNEIVHEKHITDPALILNEMHKGVRAALKQNITSNRDGMDVAICTYEPASKELYFAGAKNPLVYLQNGQMHHISGNRVPIGGVQHEKERLFKTHTINASQPTTCFIFSDGFQDQFGGPNNRKFMSKRFRQFLADHGHLPLEKLHEKLEVTFAEWMGKQKQTDDVLVLGFRL